MFVAYFVSSSYLLTICSCSVLNLIYSSCTSTCTFVWLFTCIKLCMCVCCLYSIPAGYTATVSPGPESPFHSGIWCRPSPCRSAGERPQDCGETLCRSEDTGIYMSMYLLMYVCVFVEQQTCIKCSYSASNQCCITAYSSYMSFA